MGIYINPPDMSKEDWISLNGKLIPHEEAKEFTWNKETFLICLIDNGGFTAAGVMFTEDELAYFLDNFKRGTDDLRPTKWYTAKKSDLDKVLPSDWDKPRG